MRIGLNMIMMNSLVKMIMMVRDPVKRYVSDIVHFNVMKERKREKSYRNINAIINGQVNPGRYYRHNSK